MSVFRPALILMLFATILFSSAAAQQTSTDRVVIARHFLQEVYPERIWHKTALCIEDRDATTDDWILRDFGISVIRGYCFPYHQALKPEDILYSAGFEMEPSGRIYGFSSTAHREEVEKMQAEIDAHPRWTDAEVAAALKANDFRYGPGDKERFIESLYLDRLEPFLGTIKVKEVEMWVRQRADPGEDAPAELIWVVSAECASPSGKTEGCSLRYEPFRGRLVAFRR